MTVNGKVSHFIPEAKEGKIPSGGLSCMVFENCASEALQQHIKQINVGFKKQLSVIESESRQEQKIMDIEKHFANIYYDLYNND